MKVLLFLLACFTFCAFAEDGTILLHDACTDTVEDQTLAYYGLDAVNPEQPYVAGREVSFRAQWTEEKYDMGKLHACIRRAGIAKLVSRCHLLRDIQYTEQGSDGWFTVTFIMPPQLKKASYRIKWEDKWGDDKARTPKIYVTTVQDIQEELLRQQAQQADLQPAAPVNQTALPDVAPSA